MELIIFYLEKLKRLVFPQLRISSSLLRPFLVIREKPGLSQGSNGVQSGRNQGGIDVVWDAATTETVGTVTPLTDYFTFFQTDEVLPLLSAWLGEGGSGLHDLFRVDCGQLTIGKTLVVGVYGGFLGEECLGTLFTSGRVDEVVFQSLGST